MCFTLISPLSQLIFICCKSTEKSYCYKNRCHCTTAFY